MRLETNPVIQLQMQGANSKNKTIRIIVIKIVVHYGELVNVSQREATEASGVSMALIILFMCLVKWVTFVLISGIYVIKIKSHIIFIVKVQSVAPVHFRVGKCHQMKKRHRMWLLSKVFTDLEKVFSLKWGCPPWEAFHWWRGERSADPAVRPIVECSIGVSPGREDIVLRIKRQTQDIWSQQKKTHIDYQAHPLPFA